MTITPRIGGAILAAVLFLVGCNEDSEGDAADSGEPVTLLLDAVDESVLAQPLAYPGDDAEVSVSVVRLEPGDETGRHRHDVPLVGYVLDGTLQVDYGPDGTRTYEPGDALLEAIGTSHNGSVVGDEPVRILVVNIGAEGIPNSVADE